MPVALAAQRTSRSAKLETLERIRAAFDEEVGDLVSDLHAGRITPARFYDEMTTLVKDAHAASYVTGRSGLWRDVTPQQWGRLGPVMRSQYTFLRRWRNELQATPRNDDGTLSVSEAKLRARANLYANAAHQSFERGMVDEIGLSSDLLPAYPGDGTTRCRANCRCRWSIRILSKKRGDFDATWRLGSAEHCRTCRARARAWRQLKVRGGVLQDGYEPISD